MALPHCRKACATAAKAACLAGLIFAGAILPGCNRWNWRGNGYGDDSAHWAEKMRPPTVSGNKAGLDARAQEIEQNLGIR